MKEKYEQVLKKCINEFLDKIRTECDINSKKAHPNKADYPIFKPANSSFFEYQYYEGVLEWYIRDYLITPVFTKWLSIAGIRCTTLNRNSQIHNIYFSYSNEKYGKDYLFAFTALYNGRKIAYRYSDFEGNLPELKKALEKYNIDHFEVFDWSDTKAVESDSRCGSINPELREHIQYTTLYGFLIHYFSAELADYYLFEVREAVNTANQIIGFQTIPALSLKHLSELKSTILSDLKKFPLSTTNYTNFSKEGTLSSEKLPLHSINDCKTILKNCFDNQLFQSLAGDEKYAKCFITSEYLFRLFESGNQYCFDYSTVATGYFKSIELLLEKIMEIRLQTERHQLLWIKSKKYKKGNTEFRFNPDNKINNKIPQVRFTDNNKPFFSTEMAPLIWFVHDDKNGWLLSEQGVQLILECLLNYNQGCRNEHLHKDIIDDIDSLKVIRNNTILCLLYLLGGRKYLDSDTVNIGNDSYDRLYKKITSIPSSIVEFFIQFKGDNEIRAIRLDNQEEIKYDESNGNIISELFFVNADSSKYDIYELSHLKISDIEPQKLICLSRTNVPTKIWWRNKYNGKRELQW